MLRQGTVFVLVGLAACGTPRSPVAPLPADYVPTAPYFRDGSDCALGCVWVPPDAQVMREFGQPAGEELLREPGELRFLSWNIHLGSRPSFGADYAAIAWERDFVLLQEATDGAENLATLTGAPEIAWNLAASFWMDDRVSMGVAIGARQPPRQLAFRRTVDREPILGKPKTTLLAYYSVGDDIVLVVSVHSPLFRGRTALERQLLSIEVFLRAHSGPIVMAGDFNTINHGRGELLAKICARNGLLAVSFADTAGPRVHRGLDHVFVRGFDVIAATRHARAGSDHPALEFTLRKSRP